MADYHPLIARAVAGLEKNTGENRRALYERARTALVAQLRGVQPALDESEITRERLALEEAIRKIEAESARQVREAQRPPPPRRSEQPRPEPSAQEPSPQEPSRQEPSRQEPSSHDEPPPSEPPRDVARARPPRDTTTSLSEEAMRGFRDVVGGPTAPAEAKPAEPVPPPPPRSPPPPPQEPAPQQPPAPRIGPRTPPRPDTLWALPLETASPLPPPGPVDFDEPRPQRGRPRPPPQQQQPDPAAVVEPMPVRSYGGLIRIAVAFVLLCCLGALAFWQREAIGSAASSVMALFRSSPPQTRDTVTAPATRPKITDRVGQPGTQPDGTPAVAQRVVLYEEDPDDPQGKRVVGTALWRTEMMPASPGRAAELVVRADVDIPDRKMTMTWSLRRNSDPALPASHTIEIMFNLPADAPSGGVQNVPGVLMKQAEQTRGVPLAGLAVKVTPGFFLIGLSSLDADMQRNIALLKERSWFDVPIVYNNNRRAILAMEKGTPGERAFNEAFAAWKQ